MQLLTLFGDEPEVQKPSFRNIGDYHIAEVELIYKSRHKAERPKITGSKDANEIFLKYWKPDTIEHRETMMMLLINRTNRVIGIMELSSGGLSGTICDPKIVFQAAIKSNASGVILAHNHPSGCLTASGADMDLTKKIKEAGKLLEIQVLDHLILTSDGKYFSFADEGMM